MDSNHSKILKKWEFACFVFMIFAGSLLHFIYEWSGYNPFVGLLAPVNESVWEHLKLGFTALLIFSIIEYFYIGKRKKNFFTAKITAALFQEFFIVAVFYSYTFFTGHSFFPIDISTFIISSMICNYISYRILINLDLRSLVNNIGTALILINIAAFMLFTYFTPALPVFRDSNNNSYGVQWDKDRK